MKEEAKQYLEHRALADKVRWLGLDAKDSRYVPRSQQTIWQKIAEWFNGGPC